MLIQHLVCAALGGLAGAAVCLAVTWDAPAPAVVAEWTEEQEVADQAARSALARLEARLRDLECRRNAVAEPAPERTPAETAMPASSARSDRGVDADLSAEVAALRECLALTSIDLPPESEPDASLRRIGDVVCRVINGDKQFLAAVTGIPLRTRFLEQWPAHERAREQIQALVDDCCTTHQPHKALAAVDRFGPATGMAAWELDSLRLRAADRDADQVVFAERLAHGPVDRNVRAWALERLARALARTGRRAEALATIDDLTREFGRDAGEASRVRSMLQFRTEILAGQ